MTQANIIEIIVGADVVVHYPPIMTSSFERLKDKLTIEIDGIPKEYFKQEHGGTIRIPRGMIAEVYNIIEWFKNKQIPVDIRGEDRTNYPEFPVNIVPGHKPYPFQKEAVDALLASDHCHGGLKAPTGSGKTNIAAYLIAALKTNTLIIVPTTSLVKQTIERMKSILTINPSDIGAFASGKKEIRHITVATWQTAYRNIDTLKERFGLVIADEYHKTADNYYNIINTVNARYKFGLSATPFRANDQAVLKFAVGPITHRVNIEDLYKDIFLVRPTICMIYTGFDFSEENIFTQWQQINFGPMQKQGVLKSKIATDEERNQFINQYITALSTRRNIILTFTREHAEVLYDMCPRPGKVLTHGGFPKKQRDATLAACNSNADFLLFSTQSLLSEGVDIPSLETLFIASPYSGKGKTIQTSGRVLRKDPKNPDKRVTIFDFCDDGMERATQARRSHYRQINAIIKC